MSTFEGLSRNKTINETVLFFNPFCQTQIERRQNEEIGKTGTSFE